MSSTTATPETVSPSNDAPLAERATGWLGDLESALGSGDEAAFRDLFIAQSYWGDRTAFTWDSRQFYGIDAIVERLLPLALEAKPSEFKLATDRTPPTDVEGALEVFFTFRTAVGTGEGMVILRADDDAKWGMKARVFSTDLVTLDIAPDARLIERDPKYGFVKSHPGQTYKEYQEERQDYSTRDPEVLVVGGSQSGLAVGAWLQRLGIDSLVVEKNPAPGDNWRNRYENLALHNPTDMNDMPFVRNPKTMPNYLTKDKWADWLDSYRNLADVNIWTSTEFLDGSYDEVAQRWTVNLRREDGSVRTLHPIHVIFAVGGIGGKPRVGTLEGIDDFRGAVMHSSSFSSGSDYAGKKVLVVGVGTSSHDIAFDLHHHGAEVTMLQRSSTVIVSQDSANIAYGYYFADMSQEEADQRFTSGFIYPMLIENLQGYTKWTSSVNAELHAGLEAKGMKLDLGEDETGWLLKFLRYGGGYYLNVGASDLIVSGDVKLMQLSDMDTVVAEGVRMKDGSIREFDLIVLATGYQNLSEDVADLLGKDVAAKVGKIAGFGEDGEIRNRARPTGQEHLWFMFGGIGDARNQSPRMALHIKAQLAGLIPTYIRGTDGELVAVKNKG